MAKGSFALITVVSRVEYLTSGTVSMALCGFQFGRPRVLLFVDSLMIFIRNLVHISNILK